LCHVPTLTSVALEVGKGSIAKAFTSGNRGKSAKLRELPVLNASAEASAHNGNGVKARELPVLNVVDGPSITNSNGHASDDSIEATA
jgi:hypothetical protein